MTSKTNLPSRVAAEKANRQVCEGVTFEAFSSLDVVEDWYLRNGNCEWAVYRCKFEIKKKQPARLWNTELLRRTGRSASRSILVQVEANNM